MRKAKLRLDYQKFHTEGIKVIKDEPTSTMSLSFTGADSITVEQEKKVVRRISRFLEENDFDLFFDVEEVQMAIVESRNILQEYEDVHVELENELGLEAYTEKYQTEYSKNRATMMDWIKSAKMESNTRKKNFCNQIFDKLRAEESLLSKRISLELQNFDGDCPPLIEGHERQLAVAEQLISDYTTVFQKIGEQGPDFMSQFGDRYDRTLAALNVVVSARRDSIQKMKLDLCAAEESRQEKQASARIQKEMEEVVFSCKSMYVNICDRFTDSEEKLKVQMSGLTDAQVFEKQKELKHLEKEYHEILDKILKLSQSNPCRFDATKDLLKVVDQRKLNLKDSTEGFFFEYSDCFSCL